MNIYMKIITTFLALILSFSLASAKAKVAVFDFNPVGVDNQTALSASQIFRAELGAIGKYDVLTKGDIEERLQNASIYDFTAYDINSAISKGKVIDADKSVIGSLTRLGSKIIVDVQLINVGSGEIELSDRFSTDSIEDLDVVIRRLASAISSGKKVETETNKFDLTDEETGEPRRRKSFITSGVGFGFGFPVGDSSYSDVDNLKLLSWNIRYEAGKYVVENSLGISWGSTEVTVDTLTDTKASKGVFIIPWDIGLRYILAPQSDISPYVGAGLGFHFVFGAKTEDYEFPVAESDQAMAMHFSAGIYAFQSYDFRLSVDAKYTIVFTDAFYGSKNNSQQIGISIGISRKWKSDQKKIFFVY